MRGRTNEMKRERKNEESRDERGIWNGCYSLREAQVEVSVQILRAILEIH